MCRCSSWGPRRDATGRPAPISAEEVEGDRTLVRTLILIGVLVVLGCEDEVERAERAEHAQGLRGQAPSRSDSSHCAKVSRPIREISGTPRSAPEARPRP